jgi:hypothetical protein
MVTLAIRRYRRMARAEKLAAPVGVRADRDLSRLHLPHQYQCEGVADRCEPYSSNARLQIEESMLRTQRVS